MSTSKSPLTADQVIEIAEHFQLERTPCHAQPYGSGHINDTFAVRCDDSPYAFDVILQRINQNVFPRPDQVMDNIARVTTHLRRKLEAAGGNPERECLNVIPTTDDSPYLLTEGGDYWRAYIFIQGAATHDVLEHPGQAREAAKAFGLFQKALADLPEPPLHETIADFHHTPKRVARLQAAIDADEANRLAACQPEVDFAATLFDQIDVVTEGLKSGNIPWRVTHNDTKINNVMLDNETGAGICVIDLDTVMPGSTLYDFGDQVRTSVGHFAENERDLSKVFCDMERFEALVKGYLSTAGDFLTSRELQLLPFAGILITYEIGIRFLTDYLQGDIYFKTHRPEENLDRARTQFQLVRDLQAHRRQLTDIVGNASKGDS